MTDLKLFKTSDMDLAAFLDAAGFDASTRRVDGSPLAEFSFSRTDGLMRHVESYVTGNAVISARRLLSSRRRLFRMVRGMGGGA